MNEKFVLGPIGLIFVSVYLVLLIVIGWIGKLKQKENSMHDFYLAGRGIGFFVLLMTLYATQYSGNTLIGFAGQTYRVGFHFFVSVTFMMSVIGGYLVYAPKLYKLSHENHFITPSDYLKFRFNNPLLSVLMTLAMIFAMANYILSNLKAVGHMVEGATGGQVSFAYGVIALALIMVIYETLGGMRSVAWTDTIQGLLLFFGCATIFIAITYHYGSFQTISEKLYTMRPDLMNAPSFYEKIKWLSTLLLVFFGISIYPHAIQRIYASKDEKTLKKSFQVMVFMPLVTTFFMFMVGLIGITVFPGLNKQGSEAITLYMINDLITHLPWMEGVLILFIAAAIAAIMSTIDSALLSISSMATKDLYQPLFKHHDEVTLMRFGKIISWVVMGVLAYLAIILPQTIWRLVEIKLEVLIQVAPAFFLGLHFPQLKSMSILAGFIAGIGLALSLWSLNLKLLGVHPGVWGLILNFIVVFVVSKINKIKYL